MVPDATKTGLGLEYFCDEGDALWNRPDDELVDMAKRELEKIGLARADEVTDGCVFRMPKAYPVYDPCMRSPRSVKPTSRPENLQTIGRNGLHRYNNQDHAMVTGMLAARSEWDQEYHESSRSSRLVQVPPRRGGTWLMILIDRA
jgi:protoporphyrinogen oxidase